MAPRGSVRQDDFMSLRDKYLKLSEANKKLKEDKKLLMQLHAIRKKGAISKPLKGTRRKTMVVKLGIPLSTLDSRLKIARKTILTEHIHFCQTHDILRNNPGIIEAQLVGEGPEDPGSPTGVAATNDDVEDDNQHGSRQSSADLESSQAAEHDKNILQPVACEQLPDDDVVVTMDGTTYTQLALMKWYLTTNMKGRIRKVYEAKNAEINVIRRTRRPRRR